MKNTVTIVTGAASGMGREIAKQAAALGSYVIATDRDEKGLAQTQAMIEASIGQSEIHVLDVANAKAIQDFALEIIPTLGNRKLNLVNNAGVGLASGSFENTSLEDFEWLLSINLWGVIRMTKVFLPYMIQHNTGHILNVSSVFGLAGVANQSAYCTSKFGVKGFTETLRMELLNTGIKTTVVHPGGITTSIARNSRVSGGITIEEHKEGADTFEKNTLTTASEAARQMIEAIVKQKPRLAKMADR
jgi:butyryl-CoA dehydrogenase